MGEVQMAGRAASMAAIVGVCGMAANGFAQSSTRAVFVAHYFPVNSVSPVGATIAAFRINADDSATLVENEPSGEWTQSLALSPNGKWLASANGTSSTTTEELRVYRVESDASLTSVLNTTTPDSPLDMVWVSDTVLAVTRTKTSGGCSVITYRWDSVANTLTLADTKPSGAFNSALVMHPNQPWVYAQDSGGLGGGVPTIYQFGVSANGLLTQINFNNPSEPALKPTISADGRFMFSGTGAVGSNSVVVLGIGQNTGALFETPDSPVNSPGDTPYRTAPTTDGRFVFVGHTVDDTVRTFSFDGVTGALVPTGFVFDAGPRLSLGPMAVLGNLLIVLKDSNDPIGMWVFRINTDGSLTQVGPLYDTGNRRPELAMVTWKPPVAACAGDFNGVGGVTVQDVFDFLAAWFASDPRADINGGGIGVQDVFDFLAIWFAPCP